MAKKTSKSKPPVRPMGAKAVRAKLAATPKSEPSKPLAPAASSPVQELALAGPGDAVIDLLPQPLTAAPPIQPAPAPAPLAAPAPAMRDVKSVLLAVGDLRRARRFSDAEGVLRDALARNDSDVALTGSLGDVYLDMRRNADALSCYQRAAALAPQSAKVRNMLGLCYTRTNRYDLAAAEFARATQFEPGFVEAWSNLGVCLQRLNRNDQAVKAYEKAIGIRSNYSAAHYNLGNCYLRMRRLGDSIKAYQTAIAHAPDDEKSFTSLGWAQREAGLVATSIASYRAAIRINPNAALAHFNMSLSLLQLGDYPQGFVEYRWRWKLEPDGEPAPPRRPILSYPEWQGEPLAGKTILVYAEQGIGDTLQFARFLPQLAARGAKVTFLVPQKLHYLLASLSPAIKLVEQERRDAAFDYQAALMDIPAMLGTALEDLPPPVAMTARAADVSAWSSRLGRRSFRIGLGWQGKPTAAIDRGRSLPLSALLALIRLPGVRCFSLQKEHGLDQIAALPPGLNVETFPGFDEGPDAFADTAALMMNLNLIITSDTSIAHLAGNLGRPVWLLLKKVPDWRWLDRVTRSPWYPTMEIFRQETDGDWSHPVHAMARRLDAMLRSEAPVDPRSALPLVPQSWGEIVDKLTILDIKTERLPDEKARANVRREAELLRGLVMQASGPDLDRLSQDLRQINERLWDIEDRIRVLEREQRFDAEFIKLARSVYIENDKRARVKRQVNSLLGSTLIEEKSYT